MAYNYYGKVKTVALVKALSPGVRCAFGNAWGNKHRLKTTSSFVNDPSTVSTLEYDLSGRTEKWHRRWLVCERVCVYYGYEECLNRILLLELNVVNILNGCLKHLKTRWMWRKVHGLIVCQWSINRVNTGAKSQLEDTRWMWREVSLLSTRVDCATLQRTLCYCTTAKLRAPSTNFLNKTTVLFIRHICVLESTEKYSRVNEQKQM